jgi:ribosomal protein S18 acetylase RimI-like enzyme
LTAADADAAARLIRLAFAHQGVPTDPPPSALRESAQSVAAALAAGGGAAIRQGGVIVAAVLWQPKPPGLHLSRLAVDPAWRGQGIARALVHRAEQAAIAGSFACLWLSTRLALADNRKLFASCGFIETARHAHPGYAEPTFVDMVKQLA